MSFPYPEILDFIVSGRATFICGAGISAAAPSCLPTAVELVRQIRRQMLGAYAAYAEHLRIRPEVFFQIVARCAETELMGHLAAILGSTVTNATHKFLADSLRANNHVVTTNFDLMIEQACLNERVCFDRTTGLEPLRAARRVLFKIHGSLDDPQSMFVTIDSVNRGLGEARTTQLRALTLERCVVVLGYSGLDQLDIMPVLAGCEYARLFWINHDAAITTAERTRSGNPFVNRLPRLEHWTANTKTILSHLTVAFPASDSKVAIRPLGPETQARVSIDLLNHQNEFGTACQLIEENHLRGPLYFEIAYLEARGPGKRTDEWRADRARITEELFALPVEEQTPYLATMAKFAQSEEQRDRLAPLITARLRESAAIDDAVLEAAVELAYELILHRRYSEAEALLLAATAEATRTGSVLFQARCCIERAYLRHQQHQNVEMRPELLSEGIEAVDRALFFMDDEIYGDAYFLNQARVNKANLLRAQGDYPEAAKLYKAAEAYFADISPNNLIYTVFEQALLAYSMKHWLKARQHLDRVVELNHGYNRRLLLGFINRLRARLLIAEGADTSQVETALLDSISAFELDGNSAEASASRRVVDELHRST